MSSFFLNIQHYAYTTDFTASNIAKLLSTQKIRAIIVKDERALQAHAALKGLYDFRQPLGAKGQCSRLPYNGHLGVVLTKKGLNCQDPEKEIKAHKEITRIKGIFSDACRSLRRETKLSTDLLLARIGDTPIAPMAHIDNNRYLTLHWTMACADTDMAHTSLLIASHYNSNFSDILATHKKYRANLPNIHKLEKCYHMSYVQVPAGHIIIFKGGRFNSLEPQSSACVHKSSGNVSTCGQLSLAVCAY